MSADDRVQQDQGPVPQVDGVRHVTHGLNWPDSATDGWTPSNRRRSRDDHQDGPDDGPQRRVAWKGRVRVEREPGHHDQGEPDPARESAGAHRQRGQTRLVRGRREKGEQAAGRELPRSRRRDEVRHGLLLKGDRHRKGERDHGDGAEGEWDCMEPAPCKGAAPHEATIPPPPCGAGDQQRAGDDQRPHHVELLFGREDQ